MKGAYPAQELGDLAPAYGVKAVHALAIPGLGEQRHLVELVTQDNGEAP
jgi:hypothetical protein